MAQQTINIGSAPNAGDGDQTRSAFSKVNSNFTEVYSRIETLEEGPGTGATVVQNIIGNVYAEDSTLLVDAQNGQISWNNIVNAPAFLTEVGDINGSVFADDSTLLVDAVNASIPWSVISDVPNFQLAGEPQNGDVQGSVFADDSTLLVDAVNGSIPFSVISDVQVTEAQLLVDFGAVVSTQITNNGLPINTRLAGDLDADDNWLRDVASITASDTGAFSIVGPTNSNIVFSTTTNGSSFVNSFISPDGGFSIAGGYATLQPRGSEPSTPVVGMIAVADGTSWDPGLVGNEHLVIYLNGAWVQIA